MKSISMTRTHPTAVPAVVARFAVASTSAPLHGTRLSAAGCTFGSVDGVGSGTLGVFAQDTAPAPPRGASV